MIVHDFFDAPASLSLDDIDHCIPLHDLNLKHDLPCHLWKEVDYVYENGWKGLEVSEYGRFAVKLAFSEEDLAVVRKREQLDGFCEQLENDHYDVNLGHTHQVI